MQYTALWLDGIYIVWRDLTWGEYRQLAPFYLRDPHLNPIRAALEAYRLCRIEGPEVETVPAGIPLYIARQQLSNSPFGGTYPEVKQALEQGRRRLRESWLYGAQAMISTAFKCSLGEMDSWNASTFFLRAAQAEMMLGKNEPVDPTRPAKPTAKPGQPPRKEPSLEEKARLQRARERVLARDREEVR